MSAIEHRPYFLFVLHNLEMRQEAEGLVSHPSLPIHGIVIEKSSKDLIP